MHNINNVKGLQDHKVQIFVFSDEEMLKDFLSSILPLVGYYKEIDKISLEVEKLETPISVFGKECMLDEGVEINIVSKVTGLSTLDIKNFAN